MCKCKTCGKTDAETEFYASIKTYCNEHWRQRVKANRDANIEHYREFDRARANLPHRKENAKRVIERWKEQHPDRRAAQVKLGNAVRDGHVSPLPCFECGDVAEAHHADYSQPLDVIWLCPAHHKQAHAMTRKILKEERARP